MTKRINKYLVGALLCTITHTGYSAENELPAAQKELAQTIYKRLSTLDPKNSKMASYFNGTDDEDDKSFLEKLIPLLKDTDGKKQKEGLKEIINEINSEWDEISKNVERARAINELFGGLKIKEITIATKEKLDAEILNQIKKALLEDKDYKTLLYRTNTKHTMKEVENNEEIVILNKDKMLYDGESKIVAEYEGEERDDVDLKTTKNNISSEPIGAKRIKTILDKNTNTYYFFNPKENDKIREYIADKLDNKEPKTEEVKNLLTTLHDTKINTDDAAGEAIRQYIVKHQNFKPDALQVYKEKCDATLRSDANLDEQLKAINTKIGIQDKDYTAGYLASETARKRIEEMQKKYNLDVTNLDTHRFPTQNDDETVQNALNDIDATELLQKIDEARDERDKTKQELTDANNEITRLNEDSSKLEKELNDTKKLLNESILKQQIQAQAIADYAESTASIADVIGAKHDDNIGRQFGKIRKKVEIILSNKMKDGKPLLNAKEIAKKDNEILILKNKITELENQNVAMQEELTKKSEEMTKGGKVSKSDIEKALKEVYDKDATNNNLEHAYRTILTKLKTIGLEVIIPPKKKK